ncbi:MAG TPA: prepilin peptidase [Candidatus Tectomicrobia bacterium]|nr:prepilin peptidase [Candidatus Tectomicrobia bacterium]
MIELMVFAFGLIIGSFCNVVIYRLPQGKSIATPGSQCRACGGSIRPWDNIPLLSYFILKGRCRFCQEPISVRYPLVEFATGLLFIVLYLKFGVSFLFVIYASMASTLLVVALIDLDYKIIPNIITLPGIIVGLSLSLSGLPITPLTSFLGVLTGGTLFYLIAFISKGGMGGGDIKLIAMIGAFLGWQGSLFTIFSSALLGSMVGVILMLLGKKGRKDKVPYGPFLSCGAIIFVLSGDDLIQWYLDLLF